MIFVFLFYNFCCCFALRTSPHSRKLFFINSSPPLQFNNRIQKLYEYDESFNDLVDNYESQEDSQHYQEGSFQQKEVPRDHFDLSANSVTLCGRIGFIAEPTVFPSGFRALKLSIATSDREKDGIVKTQWHRVILYGNRNVDYVYSRARVGDKALVIGQLKYYKPQNFDASGVSRPKIAEVSVSSLRGGDTFILMPKNPSNPENNYVAANQQIYPENF